MEAATRSAPVEQALHRANTGNPSSSTQVDNFITLYKQLIEIIHTAESHKQQTLNLHHTAIYSYWKNPV